MRHKNRTGRQLALLQSVLVGISVLLLSSNFSLLLAAQKRPNIIVIYTDDQGFGDASCLNPEAKFQTPNLDRLAKEGVSFTNAHSPDSVCTPSRYGLLTGRYCWRTVKKTGVLGAEAPCLIANGRVTIASLLRDNGYNTAMVGKWHLGMDFPGEPDSRDWTKPVKDMPLDKGFDHYFGIPASLNYGVLAWFEGRYAKVPPTVYTNKKKNARAPDYRIMPPYQKTPAATKALLGRAGMEVAPDFVDNQCLTRFTDKAIEWINTKADAAKNGKPFFVYLPYTSPHYPVCPLPEFHGQGKCGAYGEFVIETDHHIGRILKFLDSSGLDDNTMIVFSSDNGPENSWKNRITEFDHDSSHIYRGGKRDIYEGGHRVPFFVRWPNGIKQPGRQWKKIVGQTDLLATIAEIVDAELPATAGEDSQSFAKVLTSSDADYERDPLINHSAKGQFSITDGDWKLVMPHGRSKSELYNLGADAAEENNLAKQHPDHVKRLTKRMTEIVVNGRTTVGPSQANDTGHWKDLRWISEADYNARQNKK
jgi:arylsulfatase A